MIDDLVHLTVSEVPLAYNHPDAEVINSDQAPRSILIAQHFNDLGLTNWSCRVCVTG